ncbi:MAG: hypothetical protein NTW29_12255 [Bacteroidetes bacterium]|nr:hypothetical protein [Bacteroidota bacterium]
MKKIVFALFLVLGFSVANAQTDSLQQYTGKFKFPDGSPVSEIGVVIENGVLTATSAMGNSELKKTETKDVFEIVAYSGMATFKRNAEGKITTLQIQVQDINMEGTKTDGIVVLRQLEPRPQRSM